MRIPAVIIMILAMMSAKAQQLDIQGHRGFRGLMPENTIEGFLMALDSGVTTLEMDVVISKDSQVVVSHEPYISAGICLDPQEGEIGEENEKALNIYQMNYEEIKRYDCGSKVNEAFPGQARFVTRKPLLGDVFRNTERYIKDYTRYEVDYNIELKSKSSTDNVYHPAPAQFSELVYHTVDQFIPLERLVIQSFDFRILKYWHEHYPDIRLAALVSNRKSVDTNLANLGFKPEIYSPHYMLLNKNRVKNIQKRGIKVIPWTVNEEKQMRKMIEWGVDGIITDYPNVLRRVVEELAHE